LALTGESLRTEHRVHECVLHPPVALCASAWTRVFPPRQRSCGGLNRVAMSRRVVLLGPAVGDRQPCAELLRSFQLCLAKLRSGSGPLWFEINWATCLFHCGAAVGSTWDHFASHAAPVPLLSMCRARLDACGGITCCSCASLRLYNRLVACGGSAVYPATQPQSHCFRCVGPGLTLAMV
jgi:hypothetical protein